MKTEGERGEIAADRLQIQSAHITFPGSGQDVQPSPCRTCVGKHWPHTVLFMKPCCSRIQPHCQRSCSEEGSGRGSGVGPLVGPTTRPSQPGSGLWHSWPCSRHQGGRHAIQAAPIRHIHKRVLRLTALLHVQRHSAGAPAMELALSTALIWISYDPSSAEMVWLHMPSTGCTKV